jgi:membrane protein YqaA with SNARE-associated domain
VIEFFGVVGAALGTGFVSAVFPLVNAEAATVAAAWGLDVPLALAAVAGIALGQTAGKVAVYESARAGGEWGRRWRRRRSLRQTSRLASGVGVPPSGPVADAAPPVTVPSRLFGGLGRRAARVGDWLRAAGRRLLAAMGPRPRTDTILILSATVGLPPLLATAVAAGMLRTRRFDFAVCVGLGRLARFAVIAWPVIAATR